MPPDDRAAAPPDTVRAPRRAAAAPTCGPGAPTVGAGHPSIVDWGRTARRLRTVLAVLAGLVVVGWLVLGAVQGGLQLRLLGELLGVAVLLAIVAEVVVVGGSALRGMLIAGERGDRLAAADVSLIPPQLRRGRCG